MMWSNCGFPNAVRVAKRRWRVTCCGVCCTIESRCVGGWRIDSSRFRDDARNVVQRRIQRAFIGAVRSFAQLAQDPGKPALGLDPRVADFSDRSHASSKRTDTYPVQLEA